MTTTTERVERVARALYEQNYFPMPSGWDAEHWQRKERWHKQARAAIEAAQVEELRTMLRQYIEVAEDYGKWAAPFMYVHGQEWTGPTVDANAAKRLLGMEVDDAALEGEPKDAITKETPEPIIAAPGGGREA